MTLQERKIAFLEDLAKVLDKHDVEMHIAEDGEVEFKTENGKSWLTTVQSDEGVVRAGYLQACADNEAFFV